MPQQPMLTSSDFQEQPNSDACVWVSRTQVGSPLGPFVVEIVAALDEEAVSAANEAVDLLAKECATISNTVYRLYLLAAEDRRWMKARGVPRDLSHSEMADYSRDRTISVRRSPGGRATASISMRVRWDDEHLILFGVRNGQLDLESP